MVRRDELRKNELQTFPPRATDAGLEFIGVISTPWNARMACPRQGKVDGPICKIELFKIWEPALYQIDNYQRLEVLYWLHKSRRDILQQSPKDDGELRGTFSLRSPVRPNPIGTSIVKLERVEENILFVRGLDCVDQTPLLDLKPDRSLFLPLAPPTRGDSE